MDVRSALRANTRVESWSRAATGFTTCGGRVDMSWLRRSKSPPCSLDATFPHDVFESSCCAASKVTFSEEEGFISSSSSWWWLGKQAQEACMRKTHPRK